MEQGTPRFVVFDVETPNRWNNRMSAIAVTVLEDGAVKEEFSSLVNPEQSFDAFNTMLTGISEDSVWHSPTFPELWPRLRPMLESGLLVAHNAVFDLGVLKKCLQGYGIAWKSYVRYLCTVQMGRRVLAGRGHKLNELCEYYGIPLRHHQADSDSRACAEILLRYIRDGAQVRDFIRTYSFTR